MQLQFDTIGANLRLPVTADELVRLSATVIKVDFLSSLHGDDSFRRLHDHE